MDSYPGPNLGRSEKRSEIIKIELARDPGLGQYRDMDNAITVYEILEVAAGAYKSPIKSSLTHAVVNGAVLCRRVKMENLLEDPYSPKYQHNEGTPTCKSCEKRLAAAISR